MNNLVEIYNVSKKYASTFAVKNATISIRKNAILGFIGENGAGKTTLLKMLCGMCKPTSGRIELLFDKSGSYNKHNVQIGSLIEAPGYYPNMTAFDNIKLKALYAGEQISDAEIRELIDCKWSITRRTGCLLRKIAKMVQYIFILRSRTTQNRTQMSRTTQSRIQMSRLAQNRK